MKIEAEIQKVEKKKIKRNTRIQRSIQKLKDSPEQKENAKLQAKEQKKKDKFKIQKAPITHKVRTAQKKNENKIEKKKEKQADSKKA